MFPILGLALAALIAFAPSLALPAPNDGLPQPQPLAIVLHDADPRWPADITEAFGRFEAAGLDPVAVDVHVWDLDRSEACRGHAGFFSRASGESRVDLCLDYLDSPLGTHLRHKLVLHELAHAWIQVHTTADQRNAFMALRGAPSWNDPAVSHPVRGTEVAANTFVAMLHPDEPTAVSALCGYAVLSGRPSAFERLDPCAATAETRPEARDHQHDGEPS